MVVSCQRPHRRAPSVLTLAVNLRPVFDERLWALAEQIGHLLMLVQVFFSQVLLRPCLTGPLLKTKVISVTGLPATTVGSLPPAWAALPLEFGVSSTGGSRTR